jgi:hypothetical protein
MPCIPLVDSQGQVIGFLSVVGEYKVGDPPPVGYNDWHEWARVQYEGGLRQKPCGRCNKWVFPQEVARTEKRTVMGYRTKRDAQTERNGVMLSISEPICQECANS